MTEGNFTSDLDNSFLVNSYGSDEIKSEICGTSPPSGSTVFTLSRTSSVGSGRECHASSSSAHNSDEDDDDDSDHKPSVTSFKKDRRREAHTHAEQRRRNAIKNGYEGLQEVVPTCQSMDIQKVSKATILQRAIDYTHFLVQQKKKQQDELEALRKEVVALQIMKANYEQIVKAHQDTPQHGEQQVSDDVKFQVFQTIMDEQFKSFNNSVSVASFAELSGCVFSWLEEHCKPQSLREVVIAILRQLNNQLQ